MGILEINKTMSGWVTRKIGNIEFYHLSSSSIIKIRVSRGEDVQEIWLEYDEFADLKRTINDIEGFG